MARYLKRRKRAWWFVMEVPARHRERFGRARIELSLGTRDEQLAEAKAQRLAAEFKLKFMAMDGNGAAGAELAKAERTRTEAEARAEYQRALAEARELAEAAEPSEAEAVVEALAGRLELAALPAVADPRAAGPDEPELPEPVRARIAGLYDGLSIASGSRPRHQRTYEPPFRELAERWLETWKARPNRRLSNTASQYAAAIRLFAEFWGERPIREVKQRDAAEFVELLKRLSPKHGRGSLSGLSLRELAAAGDGPGLSTPSIKRHLGTLKQIWGWAQGLGFCSGEDPFRVRLEKHRKRPSLGWEPHDLRRLFAAPPRRRDIYEAFYVAMFTGLRVAEIADLTWGQVREEQGVAYIAVTDTKTEAGIRKVPIHSRLRWLLAKTRGADDAPVFPTFTPEGPRKSRGGDASKLFGAWKRQLGVEPRRYVFHSARKNVTAIMEENMIPANVWARIIGHEPGFTYETYNPTGLTLARAREVIELIDYPGVPMPEPSAVYGKGDKLPPKAELALAA